MQTRKPLELRQGDVIRLSPLRLDEPADVLTGHVSHVQEVSVAGPAALVTVEELMWPILIPSETDVILWNGEFV
ncbi:hypothetical protein [Nonomuraea lactucae]|uniref:hypothetical protein n=1 Tax=Nonomuraea lactucae TaxID=2249762 RepID=UPI0013B35A47|nr:hypothetical protein [Nonomuraea lactucae]